MRESLRETPHTLHERRPLSDTSNLRNSQEDYIPQLDQQRESLSKQSRGKGSTETAGQQEEDELILPEIKTLSPKTLSLGARRKEIILTISKTKIKQEKKYNRNEATGRQTNIRTHGSVHTDRTPDNLDGEFKEFEKMQNSSNDGEQESEGRLPDTQNLMDIYMSDESERGSKNILPFAGY